MYSLKNQTVEENIYIIFYEFNVFDYKRKEYYDEENKQQYILTTIKVAKIHKLYHLKILKGDGK